VTFCAFLRPVQSILFVDVLFVAVHLPDRKVQRRRERDPAGVGNEQ
jgi:hypothetical protein